MIIKFMIKTKKIIVLVGMNIVCLEFFIFKF